MRFSSYLLITAFSLVGLVTGESCYAEDAQQGSTQPSEGPAQFTVPPYYQSPGVGQTHAAPVSGRETVYPPTRSPSYFSQQQQAGTAPNTLYGGVNTMAPQTPYSVPGLQGGLNQRNYLPGNPMNLPPQAVPMQQLVPYGTPPLQGNIQTNGAPWSSGIPLQPRNAQIQQDNSAHPTWIPGYAYTNDNMITPYRAGFWMKNPIPSRVSQALLAPSVSRYWRGPVPDPCYVQIVPVPSAPGNFTFQCAQWGAPRGWLQNLQRTDGFGFPLYRYWLDQSAR